MKFHNTISLKITIYLLNVIVVMLNQANRKLYILSANCGRTINGLHLGI